MKIIISTFVAFFILTYGAIAQASYFAPNDPGVNIGMNLDAGFEPSGVVWHNRLQSLFVIWDNGGVAQIDAAGNLLHPTVQVGGDLEGITLVDDQSNFLYLLVEFPQQMKEYDISTGRLTGRTWNLQGMPGNAQSGAEALTYNSARNEFYVGAQLDGQIYVYTIDLNTPGDVNFSRIIRTGINTDIAGLSYSRETEKTYAVFDAANIIQEYTNDDVMVQQYDAPGVNQEGIALMPGCPGVVAPLLIAQDSGGVLKFNSYPIACPAPVVPPAPAEPAPVPVPEPIPVPVPEPAPVVPPVPVEPVPVEPQPSPVPQQNQGSVPVRLGAAGEIRIDALSLFTPGPTTAVKSNVHMYDAKGEYSSIKIPAMPRVTNYRVDVDARATTVDALYSLSVTTKGALVSTSKSQTVNSVNWKTYSYTITVPANTAVELRLVSGIAAGRTQAGIVRQHEVRAIRFTTQQNSMIKPLIR